MYYFDETRLVMARYLAAEKKCFVLAMTYLCESFHWNLCIIFVIGQNKAVSVCFKQFFFTSVRSAYSSYDNQELHAAAVCKISNMVM